MGYQSQCNKEDLDLIMESGGVSELQISKVSPLEIQIEGYESLPSGLIYLLKQNFIKYVVQI